MNINIIKRNAVLGHWITTKNSKNFTTGTANGIRYAYTRKNYYIDSKTLKCRYINMDNPSTLKNCNFDLVDLYFEIYPGLYYIVFEALNTNDITKKLDDLKNLFKNVQEGDIDKLRNDLIEC